MSLNKTKKSTNEKTSEVKYRYEHNQKFSKNGIAHRYIEQILDGDTMFAKYVKKVGDNDFYSIKIKEKNPDLFNIIEIKGQEETNSDKTLGEIKKMLKTNKELSFISNYIENDKGKHKGYEIDSSEITQVVSTLNHSARKTSKKNTGPTKIILSVPKKVSRRKTSITKKVNKKKASITKKVSKKK